MSTVEEIEQVIEKLPPADFERLSKWMAARQRWGSQEPFTGLGSLVRDHRAFLKSYAPEDEGLYDDAAAR